MLVTDIVFYSRIFSLPFPKQHILDTSRLKKFADDNFKFDENGRKFSKMVENTVGKVTSNFSLFHGVFKRLVLQTSKNQGLFGKGIKAIALNVLKTRDCLVEVEMSL